jgi:ABC-2 type transport system ATP-binding protein
VSALSEPCTVSIAGLSKRYPKSTRAAVDGVDLWAGDGETLGLLGPNGAGKSTTIGVCTTRTKPTAGTVRVAGWDVVTHDLQVRRSIGVVTQQNTLDRSCTVFENLYYHCRFFGMTHVAAGQRAGTLLEEFALAPRASHKPAWLSGGMVQRVQIARAIAHRPKVLFLDEPTAGLDPQSRLALWDQLDVLRENGTTIFLTTHYMEEAAQLCDRVAIMDGGRVLMCGTPTELTRAAGTSTRVKLTVSRPSREVAQALRTVTGVVAVEATPSGYEVLTSRGQSSLADIVPAASAAVITELSVREPSLEDAFIAMTGRNLRD